jgi:protein TonB
MTGSSRRGAVGWGTSVTLHAALFLAGGLILFRTPVFGVQEAPSSAEIELVASTESPVPPTPLTPETKEKTEPEPVPQPPTIIPEINQPVPDDMALPTPTPVPLPPVVLAPQPASKPRPHHQTPSTNRPLSKKSQAPSGGQKGARQAQPDYLRNPPPVYPEQARVEHRQGVVLLLVSVSDSGNPTSVSVSRSSGYTDFDDSAMRAVRRWRFRPASAGGMNIPSTVGVPVNFELH